MSQAQIVQKDWENREFVEVCVGGIRKITEFINSFDISARYRLSQLNEKLSSLERQMEYVEARAQQSDRGSGQ